MSLKNLFFEALNLCTFFLKDGKVYYKPHYRLLRKFFQLALLKFFLCVKVYLPQKLKN